MGRHGRHLASLVLAGAAAIQAVTPVAYAARLPVVQVVERDAQGCGQLVRKTPHGRLRLHGGAPGLCVRAALSARLEPADVGGSPIVNVVLLVEAPHRFEPSLRTRLFVYRLRGDHLWPRFLGSGFVTHDLLSAERVAGAWGRDRLDFLRVKTATASGGLATLRCGFHRFPLRCEPESADLADGTRP